MKKRTNNLILFLIAILILPSITCSILKTKTESEQPPAETDLDGEDSLPESEETNLPDTTGDEIEIVQTTAYLDVYGFWNIHGLLTNTASYSVGRVEIEVNLLDENETLVFSEIFYSALFGLAPGESQPFSIRLPDTVSTVSALDHYEINILQLERFEMGLIQVEPGGMSSTSYEDGTYTITGEVLNNSTQPASIHSIKAALYSEDNEIITTESCQVCTRYLDPGESGPFQFLIFGHPPEAVVEHFEVYLSVEPALPIEGLEAVLSEPVHTYTDPAGNFHIMGDIQNAGEKILDLQLLATFYDQSRQVVGASVYNLPLNSLLPGESAPYEIFLGGPTTAVDWSIQVDQAGSREVDSPSYVLSTSGNEKNTSEYLWSFSGNVVNDTDKTLRFILVVIGLREIESGRLVGLAQSLKVGEFPTGSSIEYNLVVSPDPDLDSAALEEFILIRGR